MLKFSISLAVLLLISPGLVYLWNLGGICLSCLVSLHSWFSDADEMGVLEMGRSQIPPGNCFYFGEKAAHFLLDASVGVKSVKYKMLWDLLLSAHTLTLNAIVVFCVQHLLPCIRFSTCFCLIMQTL